MVFAGACLCVYAHLRGPVPLFGVTLLLIWDSNVCVCVCVLESVLESVRVRMCVWGSFESHFCT